MRFLGRLAKLWLLLGLVGTAAYFSYFNRERINLSLPPWADTVTVPAFAAYLTIFFVGSLVTTVFLALETIRKTFEIRRLTRRLRELEPVSVAVPPRDAESLHTPAVDPSTP